MVSPALPTGPASLARLTTRQRQSPISSLCSMGWNRQTLRSYAGREWPIRWQSREYSRRSLVRNAVLSARWFVLGGELKTLVSQLIKLFVDLQGARGSLGAFD